MWPGIRGRLCAVVTGALFLCVLSDAVAQEVLRLRVATAVSGSGIMEVLRPAFRQDTGIILQVSVAGSGRSLRDGRAGLVDVLFVNAPEAEAAFMATGGGVVREPVMHSRYVLVGPPGDPANVGSAPDAPAAFRRIQDTGGTFVSRADDSGNHQRELAIWRQAGIEPYGDWYYEVGLGMRPTLMVAAERQAYLLVDEATWLQQGDMEALTVLRQGDALFEDLYSAIAVDPSTDPAVNLGHARQFIDWLTSEAVQAMIAAYEVKGVRPFEPAVERNE